MFGFFNNLFSSSQFIPHGHCYLWQTNLVLLHVVSDTLTALAYYSIPLFLIYFVYKRRDVPFQGTFILFGVFIISCGTTHVLDIWTLWHPTYWLSGLIKAITAFVSCLTAVEMFPLLPKALALPSPAQLEAANQQLEQQIAERKQANDLLQQSEARFQAFMNHSPMVAFIKNQAGQFTYINRRMEDVFHILLPQMQQSSVIEELPQAIAQPLSPEDQSLLMAGQSLESVEIVAMPPNEDVQDWLTFRFPIPDEAGDYLVGGVAFNITDRKQMEQALRRKTAQLEQLLALGGMLQRITDKVREQLEEEQILQTVVRELGLGLGVKHCTVALYDLHAATATVRYEYTTSMFSMQDEVQDMNTHPDIYQMLLQGNSFQFCPLQLDPIRGHTATLACPIVDDHEVLGNLWLSNDKDYGFKPLETQLVGQVANQCAIAIRQARLYQAAQAQVEELENLNRLKDDFLSTVSHELRTPISSIKLAIHMLETILKPTGVLDETVGKSALYFKILQDECQRESRLIDDLLDLSRLDANAEALVLTSMPIQDWLLHVIEPFAERIDSQQQTLEVDIAADLSPITTDLSLLEQVLTELLHNACKYTPPQEAIAIRAYNRPYQLQIQVSNSGVCIRDVDLLHIYDKFYRIPNSDPWKHGGTGLGLALVKRRVARLGGTIRAENRHNILTFTLTFPIAPSPSAADQQSLTSIHS